MSLALGHTLIVIPFFLTWTSLAQVKVTSNLGTWRFTFVSAHLTGLERELGNG